MYTSAARTSSKSHRARGARSCWKTTRAVMTSSTGRPAQERPLKHFSAIPGSTRAAAEIFPIFFDISPPDVPFSVSAWAAPGCGSSPEALPPAMSGGTSEKDSGERVAEVTGADSCSGLSGVSAAGCPPWETSPEIPSERWPDALSGALSARRSSAGTVPGYPASFPCSPIRSPPELNSSRHSRACRSVSLCVDCSFMPAPWSVS